MKFVVKGQGYGGSGPSINPFYTDDINEAIEEMEGLIQSDHAVQLYKNENGDLVPIKFDYEVEAHVCVDMDMDKDEIK